MKIDKSQLMFSNRQLVTLLVPLVIEQLLNSFMGMADTMMVGNISPAAISAVSLVDSINVLIIQVFAALATGAAIICSQYLGSNNVRQATEAARQVVLSVFVISVVITMIGLIFHAPLLQLIFGKVEPAVMENSILYFMITVMAYPFLALFNAGSALFRADGNSRLPMTVSVISNFMNIAGNVVLIFGFHLGVAGAAISTLVSRIFCTVVVFYYLRKPGQRIVITGYHTIRPDWGLIKKVLTIGIPSGIENGMFQFGKLAIQSTVSTMGTAAIAAQAMTNILEMVNGIGGIGIGIGLMTVVGQCVGAGKNEQAKYYIIKLTAISEICIILSCLFAYAITGPVTMLGGLTAESAALCAEMVLAITIVKPIVWVFAFIPGYGFRAAGDVKFSMLTSVTTMWCLRVALCIFLARQFHMGPMAVWIGMFADWTARGIIFTMRFFSGKWLKQRIV